MHKVITINLNGNAYQVEEFGYNSLYAYLNSAEAQLKDNPDSAEIISDLEQAIAERCRNFLGPQKSVVTSSEVDQIIREMGPVDAEEGEAASNEGPQAKQSTKTGEQTTSGPQPRKRLYRIREGKMIEGVCTGFAAYFGMDVSIVRLICVALAIASGGGAVVAYIIMIWVIPYAETSEEHAAAYGAAFNAQEFINKAKKHCSEFKKDGEQWRQSAKEKRREWQRSWRHKFRNPPYWWGPASPPPPPHPLTAVAMPIFGIITAVLSLVWILAVLSLISTHTVFGWPLPFHFPIWVAIVILLVLLQAVTAPFKFMHFQTRYGYGHPLGSVFALFASTAWLVFLAFAVWIAYNNIPEVHYFIQNLINDWNNMVNH
jgi:phage shock protein PspC (stress-responsive transcriptional regulator)